MRTSDAKVGRVASAIGAGERRRARGSKLGAVARLVLAAAACAAMGAGAASCSLLPLVDNAMVKALARAFRWRKMLDTDVHASLEDPTRAPRVRPCSLEERET